MRAALACALLLPSLPAWADGPALAHLTMAGTTITLTEVTPQATDAPMTFAQMHLGFPLPPVLHVLLHPDGDSVQSISVNGADGVSNGTGTPLGPDVFFWFEPARAQIIGEAPEWQIDAQALSRTPLGQISPLPVRIEIQLTSP
ncbi:hypothetical protein [Gymnodinialimonas sp.]